MTYVALLLALFGASLAIWGWRQRGQAAAAATIAEQAVAAANQARDAAQADAAASRSIITALQAELARKQALLDVVTQQAADAEAALRRRETAAEQSDRLSREAEQENKS